jgi:hypothetical protein
MGSEATATHGANLRAATAAINEIWLTFNGLCGVATQKITKRTTTDECHERRCSTPKRPRDPKGRDP